MTEIVPIGKGDIIEGRYRILRVLGSGGMAVVYEAEHQLTGRRCALKMIHAHMAQIPELTSMFLKEARVGSTVGRNPHIVDVLDAAMDTVRSVPFMAMELLEGETLEQHLKREGPLQPADAVRLLQQLADAFTQAHERGVVHRDLTSSRQSAPVTNPAFCLKDLMSGLNAACKKTRPPAGEASRKRSMN